jgi:hypothetical protein
MPPINWLSILIASLIPMLVGFVYYHEKVFGTAWMHSLGMTKEDAKKANMPVMFGVSFIMAFLLSMFVLGNVDGQGQEGQYDTFKHGALHGFLIGFMVAMPVMITNGLFEMKKWKNMFINVGYWLITLTLMGGVLDAMNHWGDYAPPQ